MTSAGAEFASPGIAPGGCVDAPPNDTVTVGLLARSA
jgi:hypothetical protein